MTISYYLAPIDVFPILAVVVSIAFPIHSCYSYPASKSYPVSKFSLHNLYYVLLKTSGVTLSAGVAQLG
jgi:hypothetical protein